jgi:hypothetical protein
MPLTKITSGEFQDSSVSFSGIVTAGSFVSGNVIIGAATSTGTASQKLQVTGDAHVSGSIGIGTTNPGATLNVVPTATSIAGLFSGTTSSDMVRITQEGTGNALVVEDSTNPDSTPFVVTGIGSVGIGTINPLSITHIQVPNALPTSTAQGLYVTNSSSGFTYPSSTASFPVHPGIYNNLTLDTSQTINSSTPGGFNFVYGLRNQLTLSTSSTSTDLTRLYTNAIQSNVIWTSTAPTTQITGLTDIIIFGGSSISIGNCAGSFTLSGISSSTQTATTITSPILSIPNLTTTNRIRNVGTWRGYNASLNIGGGTGVGNTTTITTAEYFSNTNLNIISAGGSGSVTNITNLYGLRLGTPTSSGTVNITNNWGISQEWSNSQNYFAGNVLVGSATSTGTESQPLQVTGGAYVSGSVGIGTTNPSQKLEVVGGEIKAGRVDTGSEGGQVSFGRATDNATGWYIDVYGNTSTPSLRFVDVSNAAVRMTVDGSGRLLVNTSTAPSAGELLRVEKASTGTEGAGIRFGGTYTIADAGTQTISVGNGTLVFVSENSTGDGALFFCTYKSATVTLISDPNSRYANAVTAGRISLTKSSNSLNATLTNNSGASRSFTIGKINNSD